MAAPTFVNAGATATSAAAIGTVGMPAGVLRGDIILIAIETFDQAVTLSGGTETWAQVTGSPVSVGAVTRLTVFWARASQDTPTGPGTNDSGDHQTARSIAFRGCVPTGDPWNVTNTGTEGSDTSLSCPGVTTTLPDCLVVNFIAIDLPDSNLNTNFSGQANADLTGLTEQMDNASNQGNGGGLGCYTGTKAVAGAVTNTTATLANAASKAMLTLALKPAVSIAQGFPAHRRRTHRINR